MTAWWIPRTRLCSYTTAHGQKHVGAQRRPVHIVHFAGMTATRLGTRRRSIDGEHYAYDRAGNYIALTGKWNEMEVNMRGVSLVVCILIGGMSVFGANGSADIPLSYVKDGRSTISGLLWDVGNLRSRSVDIGLDSFVYECG